MSSMRPFVRSYDGRSAACVPSPGTVARNPRCLGASNVSKLSLRAEALVPRHCRKFERHVVCCDEEQSERSEEESRCAMASPMAHSGRKPLRQAPPMLREETTLRRESRRCVLGFASQKGGQSLAGFRGRRAPPPSARVNRGASPQHGFSHYAYASDVLRRWVLGQSRETRLCPQKTDKALLGFVVGTRRPHDGFSCARPQNNAARDG